MTLADQTSRDRRWAERRANRLNAKRLKELPLFENTPALELVAPTVTTDDQVAWERRRVESSNAHWRRVEEEREIDIREHRAIYFSRMGPVETEIHDCYLLHLFPPPGKREYHADHWINLCRARGFPNKYGDDEPRDELRANLLAAEIRSKDTYLRFILRGDPAMAEIFGELSAFGKADPDALDRAALKRREDRTNRSVLLGRVECDNGKVWMVYEVPPVREGLATQYDFLQSDESAKNAVTLEDWQIEREFQGDWRKACKEVNRRAFGLSKKNSPASKRKRR